MMGGEDNGRSDTTSPDHTSLVSLDLLSVFDIFPPDILLNSFFQI